MPNIVLPSHGSEIPPSEALPENILKFLQHKAHGVQPDDTFLLLTNRIETKILKSGLNPEYNDEIKSNRYLGVVGDTPFVTGDGNLVQYVLSFDTSEYVQIDAEAVCCEPLRIQLGFRQGYTTNPEKPIPASHTPFSMVGDGDMLYPFSLVLGQDKVEQYVAQHSHLAEFYTQARRLLNLPDPRYISLRNADDEFIRKSVLALYGDWRLLVTPEDDQAQLVTAPAWQRHIDEVAAGKSVYGKQPEGEQIERRIRERLRKLDTLGVIDEGLFYDMHQAPGLTLDVSVFLETLERIFSS